MEPRIAFSSAETAGTLTRLIFFVGDWRKKRKRNAKFLTTDDPEPPAATWLTDRKIGCSKKCRRGVLNRRFKKSRDAGRRLSLKKIGLKTFFEVFSPKTWADRDFGSPRHCRWHQAPTLSKLQFSRAGPLGKLKLFKIGRAVFFPADFSLMAISTAS